MSHEHELVESADACALPDGLRACAAESVGGMMAISSAASSANADEHEPAASAVHEQQRSFGLLDIKGLNDTQADNEGLGAGGECTGAGNERAGDGNAIAGAGIACAGAYTIAGMACAHELRHGTPPAPSPYNLGDDDGGSSRPSQWPADALEHEFALGPVLSTLLRSIGLNLGANTTVLLRIAVRVVQEILQGERSARSHTPV